MSCPDIPFSLMEGGTHLDFTLFLLVILSEAKNLWPVTDTNRSTE